MEGGIQEQGAEGESWEKVVVSGAEGEMSVSKIDPCGICGKQVMANSVLCVKCRKWIRGRCMKVKRVTPRLGEDFVCGRCKKQVDGLVELLEELSEEVETVTGFSYLGDRVNASGGCEAAVTARARIGWVKFRECREILNSKVLAEDERNGLSELCKIGNVIWE